LLVVHIDDRVRTQPVSCVRITGLWIRRRKQPPSN